MILLELAGLGAGSSARATFAVPGLGLMYEYLSDMRRDCGISGS